MKISYQKLKKIIREAVELSGEDSIDDQIDKLFITYEKSAKNNDKFDASQFASSVARLITNFSSLLEFNNSIIRRANKYVTDNYDSSTASQFIDELKQFEISIKSKYEAEDEIPTPVADRAGPEISS